MAVFITCELLRDAIIRLQINTGILVSFVTADLTEKRFALRGWHPRRCCLSISVEMDRMEKFAKLNKFSTYFRFVEDMLHMWKKIVENALGFSNELT